MNTATSLTPQLTMETKPRVLVTPLCGVERGSWLNSTLLTSLVAASHDSRFEVTIEPAFGLIPVDYARNRCVAAARDKGFDWNVQLDNDQTVPPNVLDVIAEAGPAQDVIGLYSGLCADRGASFRFNVTTLPGVADRNFTGASRLGAGVLILHSSVWRALPKGPWFRTVRADDELLTISQGEDYYFSNLAMAAGLRLWTHRMGAGHLHTVDLTRLACTNK